ncbi:hypothetical protein AXG93_1615s1500 [Marchantia polymorpha subsp. ruderalis]|uniref:Uncharacterized protein n=1 Tax=Marchantia polymorpha subsp. ruderalis TaxID=1480154 RepID=A0A176VX77_MARPO|nr:hypothetical protein AXG93_1615s1500 [Marchantia polymorpha subsp. ruderalis]
MMICAAYAVKGLGKAQTQTWCDRDLLRERHRSRDGLIGEAVVSRRWGTERGLLGSRVLEQQQQSRRSVDRSNDVADGKREDYQAGGDGRR